MNIALAIIYHRNQLFDIYHLEILMVSAIKVYRNKSEVLPPIYLKKSYYIELDFIFPQLNPSWLFE